MKYLVTLVTLIPLFIYGQKTYAPLNAVWNYEGHEIDCLGNHKQYKVEREVMIDGKDCSVIFSYGGNFPNSSNDSLIVWEDDKKVYFLENSTFYLLYDFDVEIGDTVTYYSPLDRGEFSTYYELNDTLTSPPSTSFVIGDISQTEIDGQPHKIFHTEFILAPDIADRDYMNTMGSYLENIGSLDQRITGELGFFVADGCFGGLQCYNNETIEYITDRMFATPHPSCPAQDATNDIIKNASVSIYPNPTSDILNIESEKSFEAISIYDLSGQRVWTSGADITVDMSGLDAGIFILELRFENGLNYSRFVKE